MRIVVWERRIKIKLYWGGGGRGKVGGGGGVQFTKGANELCASIGVDAYRDTDERNDTLHEGLGHNGGVVSDIKE